MLSNEVPDLHDFTLERLVVDWKQMTVSLELLAPSGQRSITFGGLRQILIPHHEPWGPSASVNKAVVTPEKGGGLHLTIEMQSGDVIEAVCADIR